MAPVAHDLIQNPEGFLAFPLVDQEGDVSRQVRRQDGPEADTRLFVWGGRDQTNMAERVLAFDLDLAKAGS